MLIPLMLLEVSSKDFKTNEVLQKQMKQIMLARCPLLVFLYLSLRDFKTTEVLPFSCIEANGRSVTETISTEQEFSSIFPDIKEDLSIRQTKLTTSSTKAI